jgi:hypothetical protein
MHRLLPVAGFVDAIAGADQRLREQLPNRRRRVAEPAGLGAGGGGGGRGS